MRSDTPRAQGSGVRTRLLAAALGAALGASTGCVRPDLAPQETKVVYSCPSPDSVFVATGYLAYWSEGRESVFRVAVLPRRAEFAPRNTVAETRGEFLAARATWVGRRRLLVEYPTSVFMGGPIEVTPFVAADGDTVRVEVRAVPSPPDTARISEEQAFERSLRRCAAAPAA